MGWLSKHAGIIAMLVAVLMTAVSVSAGTAVSARYVQARGRHISWKISVPAPAPATILVTQHVLPNSEILNSSPPLSSYDKEKGIAKWLITGVTPGILMMEMVLGTPIRKKGEISGEVKFQDESQKTTASIFIESRTVKKALEGC